MSGEQRFCVEKDRFFVDDLNKYKELAVLEFNHINRLKEKGVKEQEYAKLASSELPLFYRCYCHKTNPDFSQYYNSAGDKSDLCFDWKDSLI